MLWLKEWISVYFGWWKMISVISMITLWYYCIYYYKIIILVNLLLILLNKNKFINCHIYKFESLFFQTLNHHIQDKNLYKSIVFRNTSLGNAIIIFVIKQICWTYSNGLVVKVLDSQSRGPIIKTTGWFQVWLSLSPSKVNQMSTRNFCELRGEK